MDLGLDEIIKKKKKFQGKRKGAMNKKIPNARGAGQNRTKAGGIKKRPKARAGNQNGTMVDARLKIIAKTRSKIVDARDRLNQRFKQMDARERILMREAISGVGKNVTRNLRNAPLPRRTITNNIIDRVSAFSTAYRPQRNEAFGRSVKNGVTRGSSAYMDIDSEWRPLPPQLEIHLRNRESPVSNRPPLMQTSPNDWPRKANAMFRSTEDVKSRLEPARQEGYRIVVSNLQPSVTHEDIKELFEDIGTLIGSRVVRPGTAEVVYKNMQDAVTAVDTYHNRQLDGQPMKCLLVKPRQTSNQAVKNIGTKGSIIPDLTTVHRALFTK